jgi:hypothetical protein
LPVLDAETSILVLAGETEPREIGRLRGAYQEMSIAIEPYAHRTYTATEENPFLLPADNGFFPVSLADALDGQRQAGSAFAMTPTGYIDAEDADSLMAAVETVNREEREDVVLFLPCHWSWARDAASKQLAAWAKKCRHPVAVSLCDRQNPVANPRVVDGIRRIVQTAPNVILWRTDVAGIDAIARGALSAAIGTLPSSRHNQKPGDRGFASDPANRHPHVFVSRLLSFIRGNILQEKWFASVEAWKCSCSICDGGSIDRFRSNDQDRLTAHRHNVVELQDLFKQVRDAVDPIAQWTEVLREAQAGRAELEAYTKVKASVDPILESWLKDCEES